MSLIKKYPLKYDVTKTCSELDTLFPLEVYKRTMSFLVETKPRIIICMSDLPQHIQTQ